MEAIRKVGKDVGAGEYWRERGSLYRGGIRGPYHLHRLAMVKTLLRDCDVKGGACVDVGCGDGQFSEYLLGQGAGLVIAFDPDEEMVKSASGRLAWVDRRARVFKAGIHGLQDIDAECADFLFALNVIAYLTDEEERLFYTQAARVLKPRAGMLVVTHSNELFDMYTLNRFTAEFFRKHFCGADRGAAIGSLLTHPDRPERVSFNLNPA